MKCTCSSEEIINKMKLKCYSNDDKTIFIDTIVFFFYYGVS